MSRVLITFLNCVGFSVILKLTDIILRVVKSVYSFFHCKAGSTLLLSFVIDFSYVDINKAFVKLHFTLCVYFNLDNLN